MGSVKRMSWMSEWFSWSNESLSDIAMYRRCWDIRVLLFGMSKSVTNQVCTAQKGLANCP